MDARDLLHGLTPAMLAELAEVSPSTAWRWRRTGRVPAAGRMLIELVREGELGVLAATWRGFRLHENRLWTPYNFSVGPGEICSIPWRFAQLAALERELREPQQWQLFANDSRF